MFLPAGGDESSTVKLTRKEGSRENFAGYTLGRGPPLLPLLRMSLLGWFASLHGVYAD